MWVEMGEGYKIKNSEEAEKILQELRGEAEIGLHYHIGDSERMDKLLDEVIELEGANSISYEHKKDQLVTALIRHDELKKRKEEGWYK